MDREEISKHIIDNIEEIASLGRPNEEDDLSEYLSWDTFEILFSALEDELQVNLAPFKNHVSEYGGTTVKGLIDEICKLLQVKEKITHDIKHLQTDEDIVDYAVLFINGAMDLSRTESFKAIGFTYAELEFLMRMALIAKDRTHRLNAQIESLKARDESLVENIRILKESFGDVIETCKSMEGNINSTEGLSKVFLDKLK